MSGLKALAAGSGPGWRAGMAGIALLAAGCSSENSVATDTRDTFRSLYATLLGGVSSTTGLGSGQADTQSLGNFVLKCPDLEVRAGSSHYISYAPSESPTPKTVRFQGSLTQTARECDFKNESITFKFGFAGRALLGPRGTAQEVQMPVRVLLAWRDDQVAWTKLYQVPVTIDPGNASGFFVHVEENFDYQVPVGHQLSEYRLYIGFDGDAAKERAGTPARTSQRR